MLRIAIFITTGIGIILIILSMAENLFLLFFGLGIVMLSVLALQIKLYAYYLFFPATILLFFVLPVVNTVSFLPNSFKVNSFVLADHVPYLYLDLKDIYMEESDDIIDDLEDDTLQLKLDPEGRITDLIHSEYIDNITFSFEQKPYLTAEELILSNYYAEGDDAQTTWLWSRNMFVEINIADHHDDYDLIGILLYAKDSQPPGIDRHIVPFPEEVTDHPLDSLFYKAGDTKAAFANELDYLILSSQEPLNPGHYEIYVNSDKLLFEKSVNEQYYFSFKKKVNNIEEVTIIAKHSPHASLNLIEPAFDSIYFFERNQSPLIIQDLSLNRYFSRLGLDTDIIFYTWDAKEINDSFAISGGIMSLEKDLLYITPTSVNIAFEYTGSLDALITAGMKTVKPYRLIFFISVLSIIILIYWGSSYLINTRLNSLVNAYNQLINYISFKINPESAGNKVAGIRPLPLMLVAFSFIIYNLWFVSIGEGMLYRLFVLMAIIIGFILTAIFIQNVRRFSR